MIIYFSPEVKVIICMDNYVFNIINEEKDYMMGKVITSSAEHLFEISYNPQFLEKYGRQYLYKIYAKLIFLLKMDGSDLQ